MKNIYLFLLFIFISPIVNSQVLSGYKFCVDPGHGGHTSDDRQILLPNGIVYWESEGDLEVAFHLEKYLKDLGAEVILTRTDNTDDSDISLSARSTIANNFGADFFQSIHTNAFNQTTNYTLTLYKEENSVPAFQAAKDIGDIVAPNIHSVLRTTDAYNRGDYSFLGFNLGVLDGATMPSLLSEGSFHDVPAEGLRLKNSEYLRNYAWAIAKSICGYYQTGSFTVGRVGGIVSDFATGNPLNGVTVTATPGGKTYTGDDFYNGFYGLDSLVPATYSLTFSKDGYLSRTEDVVIQANTYTELDLTLAYDNNGYPNVDFSITGSPAAPGETISFDASNSYDDGTIVSYEWDFGDGNTATGVQVTHAYTSDGTYIVKLTVTDDEAKSSELTKDVIIETNPPETPTLLTVKKDEAGGIKLSWSAVSGTVLTGYRIYASPNDDLSGFSMLADENDLGPTITEFTVNPGINSTGYNFKITAVNTGGESNYSDTYSYFESNLTEVKKVLIVDGYDRLGSYGLPTHSFSSTYMQGIRDAADVHVSACANEAVVDNLLVLSDFDLVIWFLGDESTVDETFSSSEQVKVKPFLEQGGYLFTTGAEIGWDLYAKGTTDDNSFYTNYLKAQYIDDGTSGRAPATGIPNSSFKGTSLEFGVVYPEDYPDGIDATGGAIDIMKYADKKVGGVAYKGTFGTSASNGAVVYLGFPLESVSDKPAIVFFMEKLFAFFYESSATSFSIDVPKKTVTNEFKVYPSLFTNELTIQSGNNNIMDLKLKIIDGTGKTHLSTNLTNISNGRTKIQTTQLKPGFYVLQLYSLKFYKSFSLIKK